MTMSIGTAAPDDVDELAAVLGRAFADDPIWVWIYPEGDRAVRLERMFRSFLQVLLARGATVLTDDAHRGVAVWQRSDARTFGVIGNLRLAWAFLVSGARLRRGASLQLAVERKHPHEPHWYLAALGTDPAHQGTGVGSSLIRHVLDDPANTGEAAYLETETEANVSFYHRHRFQVIEELDAPRGGPHLWLMWRDPPSP